jgi:hypothetical protein
MISLPYTITKEISVERDPRTDVAILTCAVDTGFPGPNGQVPPVILRLTPGVRTALIASLRGLETSQDTPTGAPSKPDSLQ